MLALRANSSSHPLQPQLPPQPPAHLTRLILPQTGAVSQQRLMERACEFPCVAPAVVGRPHTHMYMVGSRFPGADAWGAPQVRAGAGEHGCKSVSRAAIPMHSMHLPL